MPDRHVLVTGGAGFIGSHLTDRLLSDGATVTVVDNCSNGREAWVPDGATFVRRDLTDPDSLEDILTADVDRVFHLAASKAVNSDRPRAQFDANTRMTYNVLEAMDAAGVPELVYTSTSTVYGEAPRPTPEDYGPLEPISVYGASKLADEGLCSTYAHSHDLIVRTFRFANIVGSRLRGAVIPDFIEKLQSDPQSLTILGNGRQEKSYLHIDDCIDAMSTVLENEERPFAIYNLGTRTTTSVTRIADIVGEEMGLNPTYEYTGGDRGWTGDVPKMRLSIEKLESLGWEPTYESDAAVRQATRDLLQELDLLD
ncbi:NAD-dependent epimerase/dehydratase family protein [Halopiger xanaduensis]|uniref:UDP-glucose 4-epimerase n=1 Tax=Halopiger xanaduensis (strain DSM 18323 / JCM 14033 / SH-6) TaxID=797210 RepID=F8DD68_HALXS|nr:NAD-dependent epimerase/dehydratase family protein [Halopiger xanaduensis]AEH38955.1 UDP-glucose 4-epimerase [Halopiger xanaduensis SH-6]